MHISVIIPVYNADKFINRCIDSLISNDIQYPFEILLINDGSTDNSLQIIESYTQKYTYIKVFTQVNQGPANARNNGIKIAKGDFIVFVDADDYVEKDYLKNLSSLLMYTNTDLACCGYYDHSEYGIIKATNYSDVSIYDSVENFIPNILENIGGVLWDKIFRREIIINNNIKFNPEIRLSEDLLFVLEYLKFVKSVSTIKNHLYHYNRLDQEGLSKRYDLVQFETIVKVCKLIEVSILDFNVNSTLGINYSNKRKFSFRKQLVYNVCHARISFFQKVKILKMYRNHKDYSFNSKNISINYTDFVMNMLLDYKFYYFIIFNCNLVFKLKVILNKLEKQ